MTSTFQPVLGFSGYSCHSTVLRRPAPGLLWQPTSNPWLSHSFSRIQAINHFSFGPSLNHKCWYAHLSPLDVSFLRVGIVSLHTPQRLAVTRTEKNLVNIQGMNKWMNGCLHDWTDPFNHRMTDGVKRGPDFHCAWCPGLFRIFKPQELVSVMIQRI